MSDTQTQAYELCENPEQMAAVAADMIRVAVENPFDMERAAKEAIERGATVEDGKIRVKATERIPWMAKYSRFISLDNVTPLQLTFTISEADGYLVSQITIINNHKNILRDEDLGPILGWFLTGKEEVMRPETPKHVCLVAFRRPVNVGEMLEEDGT